MKATIPVASEPLMGSRSRRFATFRVHLSAQSLRRQTACIASRPFLCVRRVVGHPGVSYSSLPASHAAITASSSTPVTIVASSSCSTVMYPASMPSRMRI